VVVTSIQEMAWADTVPADSAANAHVIRWILCLLSYSVNRQRIPSYATDAGDKMWTVVEVVHHYEA
jgi:hypothetical protein